MPLNGRNFQQLAALVPGATPSYGARDSQGGVSLSGTRSFDNSFLLDGVNNSTNAAEMPTRVNLTVSPNLDAIQEFKIQSSTYDAQYGNTAGGRSMSLPNRVQMTFTGPRMITSATPL